MYDKLKQSGICTECRYRFAEPSSFLCSECIEKNRKRNRENYIKKKQNPEFMKEERERKRYRYYQLKALGYCTKCGKHELKTNTLCKECWLKQKLRYEQNKWKKNKKVY